MEDNREAGKLLFNLVQDVEGERRGNQTAGLRVAGALLRGELVSTVGGTDGDGEGVAAGAGGEVERESQPVRVAKSMTSSGLV